MAGLHGNYAAECDTFQRLEVITGVRRRRRWPRSEKARIVAESYAPGASATAVAIRHGLNRNQILAWRRQFRNRAAVVDSAGPEFVPVAVASQTGFGPGIGRESGWIEMITGGITIRVGAAFDIGDLRRVLQVVRELA